jgi:hypothetical protein
MVYPFVKTHQISQEWWRFPKVPTTLEAEAGRLLETRSSRSVWATEGNLFQKPKNSNCRYKVGVFYFI